MLYRAGGATPPLQERGQFPHKSLFICTVKQYKKRLNPIQRIQALLYVHQISGALSFSTATFSTPPTALRLMTTEPSMSPSFRVMVSSFSFSTVP